MKRALDVALNMKVQPEQKILHVIPRLYKLDGMEVKNPIGMNGYEIEVEVHLITATMAPVQNLIDCVRGLGIRIEDLVLEPLASAEAVLGEEEKLAGVLIADIGGGTTDVAVIKDGSICHTSVLPAAGRQITADLIVGLGLTGEIAEDIKKRYGTLVTGEDVDLDETVGDNGKGVPLVDLCDIMHARVEEIIRLIILDLPNEDTRLIPAGIVLTGGCANIPGIAELTEKITKLPVRIGVPIALEGISASTLGNPAYATSIGLLLWSVKNQGTANWNKRSKGWRGAFAGLFHMFR
jgi:cell division protein FtsA